MNHRSLAAVLIVAWMSSGCAGGKVHYVKPDFQAPDFVAVLPPDNHSTDLTAPRAAVGAIASGLIGLGYFPIVTPVQEAVLREMGMTDGGQLRAFKLDDIAGKLGVDGVAVTTINTFSKINLGFYVSPTVDCTVALHDASGERLWEAQAKFTQKKISITPTDALTAAATELAGDMLTKTFKVHLVAESQRMAGLMVEKASMNKPPLKYPGPGFQAPTGPRIVEEARKGP